MPTVSRPKTPSPLNPSPRVLLGPGPSPVHPRVLAALGMPLLGHLDPEFVALMDETQSLLRYVFQTENRLTMAVSGTGSAGMEAVVVNLIEPGDKMLVCVNGVFGGRMVDVAQRAGAVVTAIERPYGEVFDPQEVRDAVRKVGPKLVGIVQAETSTGAWQAIPEIAGIVHEAGAMIAIDTVTGLGGIPVEIDAWGIDAAYSGTQKCLSCPPGLAPVTFSPRAVDAIHARKTKIQSWYLDMTMISRYWGSDRFYHHTAPISMNYALREALALVVEEGLEERISRHALNHKALKAGLAAMGALLRDGRGERLAAVELHPHPRRHRRPGRQEAVARRLGDRDRWRPGQLEGPGLADRPDGLWVAAGQRHAGPGGPGNMPAGSRAQGFAGCRAGRRLHCLSWGVRGCDRPRGACFPDAGRLQSEIFRTSLLLHVRKPITLHV